MKRILLDIDNLKRLYNSGYSVKRLATEFNCSRSVITKNLLSIGIIPRNRSDAMFLRMSQTSPEERTRLTIAAHNAIRGKPQPIDRICKSAITREKTLVGSTQIEIDFCNLLINQGFSCTPQKAIGPYNIDIFINIPQIAIEIFGGGWHNCRRHSARDSKRIEYFLDCGITPLIIWNTNRWPLGSEAIKYIISLSEKLSSTPPVRSEKHMIGGNGYLISIGDRKFNCYPGKRLTYYRDITTGCFKSAIWEEAPRM